MLFQGGYIGDEPGLDGAVRKPPDLSSGIGYMASGLNRVLMVKV